MTRFMNQDWPLSPLFLYMSRSRGKLWVESSEGMGRLGEKGVRDQKGWHEGLSLT